MEVGEEGDYIPDLDVKTKHLTIFSGETADLNVKKTKPLKIFFQLKQLI